MDHNSTFGLFRNNVKQEKLITVLKKQIIHYLHLLKYCFASGVISEPATNLNKHHHQRLCL